MVYPEHAYGHTYECSCSCEQDTLSLAAALAPLLQSGDVILLDGDLGAGKTRFVQGVARALGISEEVTSPTFTIHAAYEGRLLLNHFDLYRLESEEELDDIGYWEVLEGGGVSFVEWAGKFPYVLPLDFIQIQINVIDDSSRTVTMDAHGLRSIELLHDWMNSSVSPSVG